ncbi:cation diffusion facilitator family transporter [Natranaerobius trueperi]|uniref:Cation transporter n=1 Tax=Natranaerobius trueperi TaxID=759412 RepID=A0A226C1U6_9FIRM|nr:cation transporter [Natranaerobius trueperi]OWZ84350.1 cation transporter [Natranaerobius trueperi]
MGYDIKLERRFIKVSIYVTIAFAILSFLLGIMLRSQVILFDGLYSLICIGLSSLSIITSKFMSESDINRFPFGKFIVEPLVVIIEYSVIILLVIGSLVTAILALFQGGRDMVVGAGLVYTFIGTLGCYFMYRYMSIKGYKLNSGFITVEANQWYMDTLVSTGVLIGFLIAALFQQIPLLYSFVPYVDPIMVILVSIYFLKVPLQKIKNAIREVLAMPPENELQDNIKSVIRSIETDYQINESYLRLSKIGRTLRIEINFVVTEDSEVKTISDQDKIREELSNKLGQIDYRLCLTVMFTSNSKWAG